MMKPALGLAILVLFGSPTAPAEDLPRSTPATGDRGRALFQGQVRKILSETCVRCHNPDQKKGGLDLTRHAGAVKGGASGPAVDVRPPRREPAAREDRVGRDAAQGPTLRASGAGDSRLGRGGGPVRGRAGHPSARGTRLVVAPADPASPGARVGPSLRVRVRNPIDAFVLARLGEKGLCLAPEADRATLIRRLSFDLIGLPPTPEEVDAFVDDRDPDAYERLVDRLLASPHYGERWGRHWLDVVRFGESQGYETNMPRPNAWPYRDYVIRAFNRDTPLPAVRRSSSSPATPWPRPTG